MINCKGKPGKYFLAKGPVRLGCAQGPNVGKDGTEVLFDTYLSGDNGEFTSRYMISRYSEVLCDLLIRYDTIRDAFLTCARKPT